MTTVMNHIALYIQWFVLLAFSAQALRMRPKNDFSLIARLKQISLPMPKPKQWQTAEQIAGTRFIIYMLYGLAGLWLLNAVIFFVVYVCGVNLN